eukprot:6404289-Amphidinium_carterae.1
MVSRPSVVVASAAASFSATQFAASAASSSSASESHCVGRTSVSILARVPGFTIMSAGTPSLLASRATVASRGWAPLDAAWPGTKICAKGGLLPVPWPGGGCCLGGG